MSIGVGKLVAVRPRRLVFKILTSNPLGFKILQTHFVNPAPVAAFATVRERGVGVLTSKLLQFQPYLARLPSAIFPARPHLQLSASHSI